MRFCQTPSVSTPHSWLLATAAALAVGIGACTHSHPPAEEAADRVRALGTWNYQADGIRALQRGRLQIVVSDGELVGHLHDEWRGTLETDVNLRGPYMELSLNGVRISGQIRNGQFTGTPQRPAWNVRQQHPRRRARRESKGYFQAQRVRSGADYESTANYGCAPLLRESSYACSPLQPQ